ncbi:MAG: UPF0280 family protein, partial [Deltaproteobacteria bacterium]
SVSSKADIGAAIDVGKNIEGVKGIVVILDSKIGVWGEVELTGLT